MYLISRADPSLGVYEQYTPMHVANLVCSVQHEHQMRTYYSIWVTVIWSTDILG